MQMVPQKDKKSVIKRSLQLKKKIFEILIFIMKLKISILLVHFPQKLDCSLQDQRAVKEPPFYTHCPPDGSLTSAPVYFFYL